MDGAFIILGFLGLLCGIVAGWCFFTCWQMFRTGVGFGSNGLVRRHERSARFYVILTSKTLAGLVMFGLAGLCVLSIVVLMTSTDL
jgi:hypothetical protein